MKTVAGVRWYAVQTKANKEDRAAFNLRRQDFDVFLPKYSRIRRHARKVECVQRPLFSGYLFVAVDVAQQRWRAIRSTFGVVRLVCSHDRPVPIPDPVINALLRRRTQDGCIRLDPHLSLKKGDTVRVVEGAFESCLGLFEGITANERAIILLDLLGRKVRAAIDTEAIAAA